MSTSYELTRFGEFAVVNTTTEFWVPLFNIFYPENSKTLLKVKISSFGRLMYNGLVLTYDIIDDELCVKDNAIVNTYLRSCGLTICDLMFYSFHNMYDFDKSTLAKWKTVCKPVERNQNPLLLCNISMSQGSTGMGKETYIKLCKQLVSFWKREVRVLARKARQDAQNGVTQDNFMTEMPSWCNTKLKAKWSAPPEAKSKSWLGKSYYAFNAAKVKVRDLNTYPVIDSIASNLTADDEQATLMPSINNKPFAVNKNSIQISKDIALKPIKLLPADYREVLKPKGTKAYLDKYVDCIEKIAVRGYSPYYATQHNLEITKDYTRRDIISQRMKSIMYAKGRAATRYSNRTDSVFHTNPKFNVTYDFIFPNTAKSARKTKVSYIWTQCSNSLCNIVEDYTLLPLDISTIIANRDAKVLVNTLQWSLHGVNSENIKYTGAEIRLALQLQPLLHIGIMFVLVPTNATEFFETMYTFEAITQLLHLVACYPLSCLRCGIMPLLGFQSTVFGVFLNDCFLFSVSGYGRLDYTLQLLDCCNVLEPYGTNVRVAISVTDKNNSRIESLKSTSKIKSELKSLLNKDLNKLKFKPNSIVLIDRWALQDADNKDIKL